MQHVCFLNRWSGDVFHGPGYTSWFPLNGHLMLWHFRQTLVCLVHMKSGTARLCLEELTALHKVPIFGWVGHILDELEH